MWSSKCQAFRGDSFCLPQSLTWFEVSNDAGDREDIHLSIKDNLLTLSALKPQTRREEGGFYHQTERHFGRFYRRILLPYNVDADNVKAHMDGGVLKVTPRRLTAYSWVLTCCSRDLQVHLNIRGRVRIEEEGYPALQTGNSFQCRSP